MSRESYCDVQRGSTTLGVISLRGHSEELYFLQECHVDEQDFLLIFCVHIPTTTKTKRCARVLSHKALFQSSQPKQSSESQRTMCKNPPKKAMVQWFAWNIWRIQGYEWSEIFVVKLLARCAEHKFLIFAEEIMMYTRKCNVPLLIIVVISDASDLMPHKREARKKRNSNIFKPFWIFMVS